MRGFCSWTIFYGLLFCSLVLLAVRPLSAGLEVMTDQALEEVDGALLIELSVSNDDFYGVGDGLTRPNLGGARVTVVRFASDIYIENYGEIGALKMGDYERSVYNLGDMASMDSNYTMVYGPQSRVSPHRGSMDRTFRGAVGGTNDPYYTNLNRTDRIHDRYRGTGTTDARLGHWVALGSSTAPWPNYGGPGSSPETQWDINWERMRVGASPSYPMRIYGLLLRAEFDNWGTTDQRLRRFVLGSNNLYGYAQARPLSTTGWLNAEMAKLDDEAADLTNMVAFQVRRDPIMDQYWQLSSFNFDPDNPNADGSFRQFWFNTCMSDVTTSGTATSGGLVGRYEDKNHGFFLMVDTTDRRFSGWNLIGGVNEYEDWPPLEQAWDHYFENKYRQ